MRDQTDELLLELLRSSSAEGAARAEAAEHRLALIRQYANRPLLLVEFIPLTWRFSEAWLERTEEKVGESTLLQTDHGVRTQWGVRIGTDEWSLDVTFNGLFVFTHRDYQGFEDGAALPGVDIPHRIRAVGAIVQDVIQAQGGGAYAVRVALESQGDVPVQLRYARRALPAGFKIPEFQLQEGLQQGVEGLAQRLEEAFF